MQEIKSNNEKKKKPFTRRTKPLESKAKLIRYTNFMIAPKISEKKGTCSWFSLFGIEIHGGKVCKGRSADEINNPLI